MSDNTTHQEWKAYCERERARLGPILDTLGYTLDTTQPHLGGERYLMQSVTTTSGRKLILLGTDTSGKRVVIKATSDAAGADELTYEQKCRETLEHIDFAYQPFCFPEHILFTRTGGFTIAIAAFIPKDRPFITRSTEEQFHFALQSFKAQEGAHATTFEHHKRIANTFGKRDAETYETTFARFNEHACTVHADNTKLCDAFARADATLGEHKTVLAQYGDFLTHIDFVPHNFRIANDTVYLLDHSALQFGNKYEGWARFANFMALYNPELEHALEQYVKDNRTHEESGAFHAMRIYRLGELIYYYTNTLTNSSGNLLQLNRVRVDFWTDVLCAILNGASVAPAIRAAYIETRDTLRDEEEKVRQEGLH